MPAITFLRVTQTKRGLDVGLVAHALTLGGGGSLSRIQPEMRGKQSTLTSSTTLRKQMASILSGGPRYLPCRYYFCQLSERSRLLLQAKSMAMSMSEASPVRVK